jgi:hypothetical protein
LAESLGRKPAAGIAEVGQEARAELPVGNNKGGGKRELAQMGGIALRNWRLRITVGGGTGPSRKVE